MRLELLEGFQVLVANDGGEGVAIAERERPDLILMDLNMPIVDGWEATRQLKASPTTRNIPVIALSAHAMSGERERALAAGCDEFETKPLNLDRLVGLIRNVLSRRPAR
ncbi:MAG TPA: response regulator [Alphaproteobacteria bacterium]|nr:response regulator [Alphaproteobacteria bacterium]